MNVVYSTMYVHLALSTTSSFLFCKLVTRLILRLELLLAVFGFELNDLLKLLYVNFHYCLISPQDIIRHVICQLISLFYYPLSIFLISFKVKVYVPTIFSKLQIQRIINEVWFNNIVKNNMWGWCYYLRRKLFILLMFLKCLNLFSVIFGTF